MLEGETHSARALALKRAFRDDCGAEICGADAPVARLQIVKKTDVETARGRKRRNPLNDLKREVAIMRTLRHKNIVALQVEPHLMYLLPPCCSRQGSGHA